MSSKSCVSFHKYAIRQKDVIVQNPFEEKIHVILFYIKMDMIKTCHLPESKDDRFSVQKS